MNDTRGTDAKFRVEAVFARGSAAKCIFSDNGTELVPLPNKKPFKNLSLPGSKLRVFGQAVPANVVHILG